MAAWFLFLSEIDGNAGDGVVSCDVPLLPRTFCNGSECCTLSFIRKVISLRFLVKALRNPHLLLFIYYHHRLDSTKVGFFVNERVELRTNLMEWFVVTNFHRISINLLPHKTKFVRRSARYFVVNDADSLTNKFFATCPACRRVVVVTGKTYWY